MSTLFDSTANIPPYESDAQKQLNAHGRDEFTITLIELVMRFVLHRPEHTTQQPALDALAYCPASPQHGCSESILDLASRGGSCRHLQHCPWFFHLSEFLHHPAQLVG